VDSHPRVPTDSFASESRVLLGPATAISNPRRTVSTIDAIETKYARELSDLVRTTALLLNVRKALATHVACMSVRRDFDVDGT